MPIKLTIGILFYREPLEQVLKLANCLDAQSDQGFELIIVLEKSENLIDVDVVFHKFKHRLLVFRNLEKMGTVFNRNLVIKNTKTEYLSFIDGDDLVNESYVEFINKAVNVNIDFGVFSYFKVEVNNIEFVDARLFFNEHKEINIAEQLVNWKIHGCSLFRVSCFDIIGLYKENDFEDLDLMIRILADSSLQKDHIEGVIYYWHRSSDGRNATGSRESYLSVLFDNRIVFKQNLNVTEYSEYVEKIFCMLIEEKKFGRALLFSINEKKLLNIFRLIYLIVKKTIKK